MGILKFFFRFSDFFSLPRIGPIKLPKCVLQGPGMVWRGDMRGKWVFFSFGGKPAAAVFQALCSTAGVAVTTRDNMGNVHSISDSPCRAGLIPAALQTQDSVRDPSRECS